MGEGSWAAVEAHKLGHTGHTCNCDGAAVGREVAIRKGQHIRPAAAVRPGLPAARGSRGQSEAVAVWLPPSRRGAYACGATACSCCWDGPGAVAGFRAEQKASAIQWDATNKHRRCAASEAAPTAGRPPACLLKRRSTAPLSVDHSSSVPS